MLTAKELQHLKKPGMHAVGGGAIGLYISVHTSGTKSWIYRYQFIVGGVRKRREKGLGSSTDVSLSEARIMAQALRKQVREGIDPLAEKALIKQRIALGQQVAIDSKSVDTFKTCALAFIENKSAEWSNEKQKSQWISSLKSYAFPYIGDLPVNEITVHHMKTMLDKIWLTKHVTATRVRSRCENIIDYATVAGFREGTNPASLKSLNTFLPKSSKVFKSTHFASLPYADIPKLMTDIMWKGGVGYRALELLIYTGKRSGEIREAAWSEFDLKAKVWTIPAERMKNGKPHREPLTSACLKVLHALDHHPDHDWLFPGPQTKRPISDMTMSKALKSIRENCTPHGFRSSFRQWAAEQTNYPREICEMALSHSVLGRVEAAYQRSDLFEKRKELMLGWSAFCCSDTEN